MTAFGKAWGIAKGCTCKPGEERDNCLDCEGTGNRIDFSVYHICPKCGKRGDGMRWKHKINGCEEEFKFNPDWQDKLASTDIFTDAWIVVKGWEVSEDFETRECKGCGNVHGSPDSDYCSEICERENS